MTSRGARAQVIPVKTTHKGKLRALSEKSPNMTHADWAMENMCRTPGENHHDSSVLCIIEYDV